MESPRLLTLYGMSGQEPEGDSEKKAGGTLGQTGERSCTGCKLVNLQAQALKHAYEQVR
jgi:hypothetical protein